MINYEEEDIKEKKLDFDILKRLLGYAKPYTGWLIISFLTIFLATGADLARPYMIKIAVDDYISASNIPMRVYSTEEEMDTARANGIQISESENGIIRYVQDLFVPSEPIEFEGNYYLRDEAARGQEAVQLVEKDKEYFLIQGTVPENSAFTVENGSILLDGQTYEAEQLTKEEYLQFRENDFKGIRRISVIFLVILIAGFFFNYLQVYLLSYIGQKVIHSMRNELYSHVIRLPLKYYNDNPVGRLVTRLTNDMENLNELYTSVIVSFFKDIFLLIGIMIIMGRLDLRISAVIFIAVPIIGFITAIFRTQSRKAYRRVRIKLAVINSALSENITGMRIIQIFAQEKRKFDEFNHINTEHKEASLRELVVFAIFRPLMDLVYSFALALLVWYGGGSVLDGAISFGVLFAFISYVELFFEPIYDFSEKFNIMQSAMASSERIFELLDEKDSIEEHSDPVQLDDIKGRIEFRNVWFAYKEEDWVLRDVSFTINEGETAAFVGATGSGKTTIISLITRLYDIQKGEILLDGVNIKELEISKLRKSIASVLQDVFLFTGDIKSNIRLNNEDITDEKIRQVAEHVNADRFISRLPNGYDSKVEEGGATFSSGERQLLAFARALAFNPGILILDEATSNIDTQTELLIQDAITRIIKGRTTIVVAHRLSTIQHADKIIVMHKGKVREMGRHDELLAQRGMYYSLYLLQYKDKISSQVD